MSGEYERRLQRALAELEGSTITRMNYAPPLFRLTRALGLRPRPPHYMGFTRAALLMGPSFGAIWGAIMWALTWRAQELPLGVAIVASLSAGVLFGLAMAAYYRWSGARAGLSRWQDL